MTRSRWRDRSGLPRGRGVLYALTKLGLSAPSTGYVLAYVGVILVLVQGVAIGPLTARVSEPRIIVACVAVLALTLLAWGFVPNVPLLLVVPGEEHASAAAGAQ